MARGCRVLTQTLQRLGINCQVVDSSHAYNSSLKHQAIAFLSKDESSWKTLANRFQNNQVNPINFNVLISPLSKADVQKRLGKKAYNEIRVIELPFSDKELISALSPLQAPSNKDVTDKLESKKWRSRRLSNKCILVVDDDLISLEISQQILVDLGMKVMTANTGEHALALCESNGFDAILLDCHLPGISGYCLLYTSPSPRDRG